MSRMPIRFALLALLLVSGCTQEPNSSDPTAKGKATPQPSGAVNEYGGSVIVAASKGDQAAVELLLSKGGSVNEKDKNSETSPLFEAIWVNHLGIVKVLVEHGADVNKIQSGKSMLEYAKMRGNPEVIAYLESKGAK